MFKIEPLFYLLGINISDLSKKEGFLLEAELFLLLCEELKLFTKLKYKTFFHSIKSPGETEDSMLEIEFIRLIINDILATEEYTLTGIARYTGIPEEVIGEIYLGFNKTPSALFLRSVIEIHRKVRRDLYEVIAEKVKSKYLVKIEKEGSDTK